MLSLPGIVAFAYAQKLMSQTIFCLQISIMDKKQALSFLEVCKKNSLMFNCDMAIMACVIPFIYFHEQRGISNRTVGATRIFFPF